MCVLLYYIHIIKIGEKIAYVASHTPPSHWIHVTEFHILSQGVALLHSRLSWLASWLNQLDNKGSIWPGSWLFPLLTMSVKCSLSVRTKSSPQPKTCLLRNYCTVGVSHRGSRISEGLQPRLRVTARLWKSPKNQPEAPSLLSSFSEAWTVRFPPNLSPYALSAPWIFFIPLCGPGESVPWSTWPSATYPVLTLDPIKVQGAPISMPTPEESADYDEPHS